MKKRKTFFQMMVFSALVCFGVASCGGGGGNQSSVRLEKINITAADSKTNLILGETVQLTPSVEGVTWTSEDATVASVSETGLVTSLKVGSTKITATKNGYRDGSITIRVDLETIQITAAGDATEIVKGNTLALTANKEGVTWSSSNNDIATVDAGVVTGVAYGSVTISASKDGFNAGSIALEIVRPAPTAVLHMEDADHYAADGEWEKYSGDTSTPVYERTSGNASDATCIAYMNNGDKETLTFSSNAEVRAELVMMMAARSAVSDMSTLMDVTFNNNSIDLAGKSFAGGGDTNTFVMFSFGEVNIVNGNNVLDFSFKGSSPYMDDLMIYAESAATIAVVPPAAKDPVTVNEESITVQEGKTAIITSSMDDLSYKSNNAAVATVDDEGIVTGVGVGETTISVSKDGYTTIKVPVTVTANDAIINVGMDDVQGEGVSHRDSQNISGDYKHFIESMEVDAVATLTFNAAAAGNYKMMLRSRASGGYQSTAADDLATCIELKVNGTVISLTGEISGSSFVYYDLGVVALNSGANTIEIKCLTTAPQMNLFRFIPVE